MVHFKSIFAYSFKQNVQATYELIATKLRPKKYTDITADTLKARMDAGEQFTVVDCRAANVFRNIGHIEGAINCPAFEFDEKKHLVSAEKQVVVVCYFGFFCQIAAQKLSDDGHKNVLSMKGGMEKWIMSDKPIVKDAA